MPEVAGKAVYRPFCRDIGDSVLRGKGKLALPVHYPTGTRDQGLESEGAQVCTILEEAWRAEWARHQATGVMELAVAWMEYRLDRPG
jgi:hypothetical protein